MKERLDRELACARDHGVQYWSLFASGEHVGCCGIRPNVYSQDRYELGFHLRAGSWGKGYASEAARAVVVFAFETLGQVTLFAGHHPSNEGSKRVLEGLGFVRYGTVFFPPTGLDHPAYRLTRV